MVAQATYMHFHANYNVSFNAMYLHIFGCIIQLANSYQAFGNYYTLLLP